MSKRDSNLVNRIKQQFFLICVAIFYARIFVPDVHEKAHITFSRAILVIYLYVLLDESICSNILRWYTYIAVAYTRFPEEVYVGRYNEYNLKTK